MYTIKIVNKSLVMVNNIKYSLYYLDMINDKMSKVTEIKPRNMPILALDRFNHSKRMEKTHYAITVSYNIDPGQYPISENNRFEFVFMANHSFSNATIYMKKQYYNYDILEGTFEDDDSVNILCNKNI